MVKKAKIKPAVIIIIAIVVIAAIVGIVLLTTKKDDKKDDKKDNSIVKYNPQKAQKLMDEADQAGEEAVRLDQKKNKTPEEKKQLKVALKKMEDTHNKYMEYSAPKKSQTSQTRALPSKQYLKDNQSKSCDSSGRCNLTPADIIKLRNQRNVLHKRESNPWVRGGVRCNRGDMQNCVRCGKINEKDINGKVMTRSGECAECDCSQGSYLTEDGDCAGKPSIEDVKGGSVTGCPKSTHEYKEVDVNGRKCGRCVEKTETGKIPTLSAAEKAKIEKDMEMAGKDPFAIKASGPWFEEKFTVTPDCVF